MAKRLRPHTVKPDVASSSSIFTMSWLEIREKLVEQALQDGDIPALREISALPGGFGI